MLLLEVADGCLEIGKDGRVEPELLLARHQLEGVVLLGRDGGVVEKYRMWVFTPYVGPNCIAYKEGSDADL